MNHKILPQDWQLAFLARDLLFQANLKVSDYLAFRLTLITVGTIYDTVRALRLVVLHVLSGQNCATRRIGALQ